MSGDDETQLVPVYWHPLSVLWLHDHLGIGINYWDNGSRYQHRIPEYIKRFGFAVGSDLENRTALALIAYGITPSLCRVQQQYRIGRFRGDFALPDHKVVVEVDGIYHTHEACTAKDARRDDYFADQGWTTYRIDCTKGTPTDKESIPFQVSKVFESLVISELGGDALIHHERFLPKSQMSDFSFLSMRAAAQQAEIRQGKPSTEMVLP